MGYICAVNGFNWLIKKVDDKVKVEKDNGEEPKQSYS